MITFTVKWKQGRKIFEQFLLKPKIIISVLQKNIREILLIEKNTFYNFSCKFLIKLGIILIILDWGFLFFSSRKLVLFLEGNWKIFSLSDILNHPDFQGKNSSGVRKLQSGQSNLFLTSFFSASVIRHV